MGPDAFTAAIRFSGIPQRPKPPTRRVFPLLISSTAAAAEGKTLEDDKRVELAACLLAADTAVRVIRTRFIFEINRRKD